MGAVYPAYDPRLDWFVALKLLREGTQTTPHDDEGFCGRLGLRRQADRAATASRSSGIFRTGCGLPFRVELSPLQSTRALRLHRPVRGWHSLHWLCAKPACARTGAQQRSWRQVHRGPASGTAGVSGSVRVCGEGTGTRVCSEATDSGAEGRVSREWETTPPLNRHLLHVAAFSFPTASSRACSASRSAAPISAADEHARAKPTTRTAPVEP